MLRKAMISRERPRVSKFILLMSKTQPLREYSSIYV